MAIRSQTTVPASVIGTWTAVNDVCVNGQRQTALAVVQFKPDGTFVEGYDLANHASTFLGRYIYDNVNGRLSFIIDSASGDGPQSRPFHQTDVARVFFDNPSSVRLNNDLFFDFQSTSVAPADFKLPPAPTTPARSFNTFTGVSTNPFSSFGPSFPFPLPSHHLT